MTNDELKITHLDSGINGEIAAVFQTNDTGIRYFLKSQDAILVDHPEVWLCFSLLPAMTKLTALNISASISQRFLEAMPMVQDIYSSWIPFLKRVEIHGANPIRYTPQRERRVGCFFSGGVDSWYTFLKHREEITDLIFVHGFDIRLDDTSLYRQSHAMIERVATHFNKRLIEVQTNLRAFTDKYIPWTMIFGPAMASVGHALSDEFGKIYIASTHSYADLIPSGSHPLLDPLWNSETLEFVHDGCEADRLAKVGLLSGFEIALQTLHVCWKNPDGAYNCGKCEKCLRTMIELKAVGALERCPTFNIPLDLRWVARMPIPDDSTRRFVRENIRSLEAQPEHRRIVFALHFALALSRWKIPLMKTWVKRKRKLRENHSRLYHVVKRLFIKVK
jgi:hypothetical protein